MSGNGRGRKVGGTQRYDPSDPETWPMMWQKKEAKILYMFDIISGGKLPNSPRQDYIDEMMEDKRQYAVMLNEDMIGMIADINAMYKIGGFSRLPLPVAERIATLYSGNKLPFKLDEVAFPDPSYRPWKPSDVIRMSLMVFRLYLMGSDPMFNRVFSKTLDLKGDTITMEKLVRSVERMASYEGMFEIEDTGDFDFDNLGDLEFLFDED